MSGLRRLGRLSASKPANLPGKNAQTSAPARTRTARKPPARTRGSSTRSADGHDNSENPCDPEDSDHPENPGRRRNNKQKPGRSNLAATPPVERVLFAELLNQKGQKELPAVQINAIDIPLTPQFVNKDRFLNTIENGLRVHPTSLQVYKPSTGEMSFVWDAEPRED
jgi:hypothetical protein